MGIFVFIVAMSYFDRVSVGSLNKEFQYNTLKATALKEEQISKAITRYIIDHDSIPTIQNLIDNNYISVVPCQYDLSSKSAIETISKEWDLNL